jgi:tetratricopeptide (TPR) repeat protein
MTENQNFGRDQFIINQPTGKISIAESYGPQEVIVSGVGDRPPNYASYWVDRVAVQAELEQRLAKYPVAEVVAGGGFGKSSLAAWAHDQFKGQFDKRVWIEFRQVKSFDRVARWILQEIGFPNKEPQVSEDGLLKELLYRLDKPDQPIKVLVVLDRLETMVGTADWQWFEQFLGEWMATGQGSRVLVTSRSQTLAMGAIGLGGLSIDEGRVFLERQGVVAGEFGRLVELAEGHPLLLRLAAAWVKQTYGGRVDDRAIDFFSKLFVQYGGDLTAKVEDVFGVLFEALPDRLQELLLKVSVYRLPIDLAMAEGMGDAVTIADLESLAERGLLLRQDDLFVLHPLVEEFIRSRLSEDDRTVAHEAAIDFYEANYQKWDGTIASCREELEVFYHACELGHYGRAYAALDRCHDQLNLRGYYRELLPLYERLVGEWEPEDEAGQKAFGWAKTSLGNLYESLGQYERAIAAHESANAIFEQLDFAEGRAASLGNLGIAYKSLGQYQRAIDCHQQHNEIAREIGDRQGEATSLMNLGIAYDSLGQYQRAIDFHQQSLEIQRKIGDRNGEASSLGNLGSAYKSLGQYQRAIDFQQQSLEITRDIGDRNGEANSLIGLGDAYNSLGQYQRAIDFQQQSLEIEREIGDRNGEAASLGNLGNAYYSLGQYQRAIDFYQQSLEIQREIGDRNGEAASLSGLGNAYGSLGQYQRAIDFQQQSLEIKREIGDRHGEANSLFNMANALAKLDNHAQALLHFQQAQNIFTDLELDHMVEKCKEAIRELDEGISHKAKSAARHKTLYLWFTLGLAICFLIWWLKK